MFKLFGKPENLRHAIFEGPHDYSKAMREAMYGFMTLHLKGEGNGDPIPEPKFTTENPEDLRCYPGDTRPKDFMTIPKFAAAEGKKMHRRECRAASGVEKWAKQAAQLRTTLIEKTLGGFPDVKPVDKWTEGFEDLSLYNFQPEPGLNATVTYRFDAKVTAAEKRTPRVDPHRGRRVREPHQVGEGRVSRPACVRPRSTSARQVSSVWSVTRSAVRRTTTRPSGACGSAARCSASGCSMCGNTSTARTPIKDEKGQIINRDIIVIGEGAAGLVALCAAATDTRITKVAAINSLGSFATNEPYVGQRLGMLAPGHPPRRGRCRSDRGACAGINGW